MENNSEASTNLGCDFAFIRRVLGLKQADFAKLIGVSTQSINAIEKGGEVSKDIAGKAYVEFMGLKRMSEELHLREEEVYSIDKFIERLSEYIDELRRIRNISFKH